MRQTSHAALALAVGLAALAGCSRGPAPAAAGEALPFIEDDYARAVTEARAKKLPIFVDAWAPW